MIKRQENALSVQNHGHEHTVAMVARALISTALDCLSVRYLNRVEIEVLARAAVDTVRAEDKKMADRYWD